MKVWYGVILAGTFFTADAAVGCYPVNKKDARWLVGQIGVEVWSQSKQWTYTKKHGVESFYIKTMNGLEGILLRHRHMIVLHAFCKEEKHYESFNKINNMKNFNGQAKKRYHKLLLKYLGLS